MMSLCPIMMSLCPIILHDIGLRALNDFLLYRNLPTKVVNGIINMTKLVHKQNVLEYHTEHFPQTLGTIIGTKLAPAYGNVAMSMHERNLSTSSHNKPLV